MESDWLRGVSILLLPKGTWAIYLASLKLFPCQKEGKLLIVLASLYFFVGLTMQGSHIIPGITEYSVYGTCQSYGSLLP